MPRNLVIRRAHDSPAARGSILARAQWGPGRESFFVPLGELSRRRDAGVKMKGLAGVRLWLRVMMLKLRKNFCGCKCGWRNVGIGYVGFDLELGSVWLELWVGDVVGRIFYYSSLCVYFEGRCRGVVSYVRNRRKRKYYYFRHIRSFCSERTI